MENIEKDSSTVELSNEEAITINGGDSFLHDLGYAFGRFVRSFVDQKPDPVAVRTWTYLH